MFTTNDWATNHVAYGAYNWTMKSGLERSIAAPVSAPSRVKFALFYRVLGSEYWDNNFYRDYLVTPASPIAAGAIFPEAGMARARSDEAVNWSLRSDQSGQSDNLPELPQERPRRVLH